MRAAGILRVQRVSEAEGAMSDGIRFVLPVRGKPDATLFIPADLEVVEWDMIDGLIRLYLDHFGPKVKP
jgi:hypothetical protein